MAENKMYLAVGVETSRGTPEVFFFLFIPLLSGSLPKFEPDDVPRGEFRGDEAVKGETEFRRMSRKWSHSIEFPFFSEAGTTVGMIGSIFKHFFGTAVSAQNATTAQYSHIMYIVANPFAAANLDDDALTFNYNINEGAVMKNWPWVGARVSALNFDQEAGQPLKVTADVMGQYRDTVTAELGSPVFPAENLRADFNNCSVYTGTITRVGSAPDYTDFTFGSATLIKPDKISVKLEDSKEDVLRVAGVDYPDKTRMGKIKATIELTIDWEDPAAGFSSVDDFNAWVTAISETNFCIYWDTGTQAGTGDNHGLYLDIPRASRKGGEPEYDLEKDPMVTLTYEALLDTTTTEYLIGLLLKNTATAV